MLKYLTTITAIILSTILFYHAAGNLKIKTLNIISYAFYSLLLFDFIGISLIYLGFDQHYLIVKVLYNQQVITQAYWSMVLLMLLLPISIIFFNKNVYGMKNIKSEFFNNINKVTDINNKESNKKAFIICTITFIICLLSTIYVFIKIGYIPLLKYFSKNFNFFVERIKLNRNFIGNDYIKNIVMLAFTPLVSYLSYIYMRTTKLKCWKILFIFTFILSVFVKTYDFSKAPIIYYILYFYFIEIMLGKIKNIKKFIPYVICSVLLVVGLYLKVNNYKGNFISLSNGPVSRVVITQPGTLLLHFDSFPRKIPYLKGHSFPKYFKIIFGDGKYGIRSGREVMKIYNPKGVKKGQAGVMSTVFIGEAYANFGIYGIVFFIVLVGFILSTSFCLYLKAEKNPLNICLYIEATIIFVSVIQTGMVEYIYNVVFICILLYILLFKFLIKNNKTKIRLNTLSDKEKKDMNKNKKRIIFHIPNYLDLNRKSGSQIRPLKMINAFKDIGYDVDIVMGYGKERSKKIKQIKHNIKNGFKYDFLYSESSTMPTLLTEKNHFPVYPNLDFSFFKYCKKRNIKIGLFYRDIYWKFEEYKKSVSLFKKLVSYPFYKYDLFKYNKLVDTLFLPSIEMSKYMPELSNKLKVVDLPPGIEKMPILEKKDDQFLKILYVGGVTKPGGIYGIENLLKIANNNENVIVYVCCRKNEWDKISVLYEELINDRVIIIHKSGEELYEYYDKSDLCSLIFPFNEYRSFSMPIKLFEYLSHQIPVITTPGTVAAKYIQKNKVGFVVKNDENEINRLIRKILSNKKILYEKVENIKKIYNKESWEARAKLVEKLLK